MSLCLPSEHVFGGTGVILSHHCTQTLSNHGPGKWQQHTVWIVLHFMLNETFFGETHEEGRMKENATKNRSKLRV